MIVGDQVKNFNLYYGDIPVVMLAEASPELVKFIAEHVPEAHKANILPQLPHVVIPAQGTIGNSIDFPFEAVTVPILTPAQKKLLPMGHFQRVHMRAGNRMVELKLDEYGYIYYMWLGNMPEIYDRILSYMPIEYTMTNVFNRVEV